LATTFFAAGLAATFLATGFLATTFFATAFFAAGFLATTFFAAGLAATFLAAGFLATTFFATAFFAAGFLATAFFAAGLAATFLAAGLAATTFFATAFFAAGVFAFVSDVAIFILHKNFRTFTTTHCTPKRPVFQRKTLAASALYPRLKKRATNFVKIFWVNYNIHKIIFSPAYNCATVSRSRTRCAATPSTITSATRGRVL
jgi:hypothetical protein